jgi:D-alanyl-D-alanine endopeptidase (penicillin-binding protein 7)
MQKPRLALALTFPLAFTFLFGLLIAAWMLPSRAEARYSAAWVAHKRPAKSRAVVSKIRKSAKHGPKKSLKKRKVRRARLRGVRAKAVFCVNLAGNRTLMARNADRRLPVASLTKLVTALVVLDHMSLNRKVPVPKCVRKIPKSRAGLRPGDRLTVRDLLHGMLIGSANDCAETLAYAFPGGKAKFIRAMNRKAKALGARRTFFYTPSGLDRKRYVKKGGKTRVKVKSNVSTAREMARIARKAFSNKTIRSICRKKRYVMKGRRSGRFYKIRSTNKLLRDRLPIVGGKTGYTNRAGHCLASKFRKGRNVLLIVVLGSPDHFRDTRLVYRMAMKKSRRSRVKVRSLKKRRKSRLRRKIAAKRPAPSLRLFSSIY